MREIGEIGLVAFDDGRVCSEHHVRQIVGSLNGHFRRRRRYRWPKIEAHELALERERPILIELLLLYSSSPKSTIPLLVRFAPHGFYRHSRAATRGVSLCPLAKTHYLLIALNYAV